MKTETNIFRIANLSELSYNYRLFEIVGLNESTEEYEENIQRLIRKLSFKLHHPITSIMHEGKPHLVIKDDQVIARKIPKEMDLVRKSVVLTPLDKTLYLDFENCNVQTSEICLRF